MSKKTLKGITIEIGGNATPLNKVLSEVDAKSRSLQRELKTVDNLLKLDPTNTELVAQKQQILSENISTTSEKLEVLRSAQDKVEKAFKNGEMGDSEYRAFRRNIINTEEKLRDLQRELNDTGQSFDDLGTDAQKSESKLNDYQKEVDDVKDSVKELKDTAKDTALEIGAGATAIAGTATAAIMSFDSVESALNHIQTQTGKTNSEMNGYKDILEAIYNGNYGEDMTDIANVMALVSQYTKETEPEKIQKATENALTLRDTYEFDCAESLRTVTMLTDQFAISSEEAFNLVVQGAQKGLNKNGDLLDTINEYAVHYKQQGYSAEEFFNSLENGAEAGTFSVDKLGDAMKEFGIRTKDNSTTSIEAFQLLGYSASASAEDIQKAKDEIAKLEQNLSYAQIEQQNFNDKTSELTKQKNADKIAEYSEKLSEAKDKLAELTSTTDGSQKSVENLQAKFAEGGESAREATQEVLEQLFALDDKVLQNQAGVALFGSMWEDLGIDGVKALMDVSGSADKTVESMEKIKEIEYDDLGNKLEGLGRTVQTEIINPTVEDFYPEVEQFIEWAAENIDLLIPLLKSVAGATASIWIGKKVNTFTKEITTLVKSYKTLKTATESAKIAQDALNLSQKANVIGAVVSILGTLISVIWSFSQETEEATKESEAFTEAQEKQTEKVNELSEAYKNYVDSKAKTLNDTSAEFQYYNDLWTELQGIIDQNGKVQKGYEDRAKFITEELEEITGNEIEWNGNVITSYENLQKTIQDTLKLREAEAVLSGVKSDYITAVQNVDSANAQAATAYNKLIDTETNLNNEKTYLSALKNLSDSEIFAWLEKQGYISYDSHSNPYVNDVKWGENSTDFKGKFDRIIQDVEENISKLQEQYNSFANEHVILENTAKDYQRTIDYYSNLSAAVISKDTDKIDKALDDLLTNFVTAKNGTRDTLKKQLDTYKTQYSEMKKAVENGAEGVTQAQVDELKRLRDKAQIEYDKHIKSTENTNKKVVNNFITARNGTKESLEQQVEDMKTNYDSLKTAIEDNAPGVTQEMVDNAKNMVDLAVAELDKFKGESTLKAKNGVDGFVDELRSDETNRKLADASSNMKEQVNSSLNDLHSEGRSKGNDFGDGFSLGIQDKFMQAFKAGGGLAINALAGTQSKQESNSPAKASRRLGKDNGDGYILGIQDKVSESFNAGEKLADSSLSAMRARQKVLSAFNSPDNRNTFNLPFVTKAQIQSQTAPINSSNEITKQIALGGLTIKIEHFENRTNDDIKTVTEQFMHEAERYIQRRDAFK